MISPTDARVFEIKKYPNRRFYDVTSSRHVTLDDLYETVKEGHSIVVTDSKSGADITNVVLTQIILEHDPPKLDLFPASLLHQAIQANQQMVRRFVDEYFAQAVNAFSESRRKFDEYLRKSGFSALQPMAPFDWVRMLFPGMGGSAVPPREGEIEVHAEQGRQNEKGATPRSEHIDDLRDELDRLRSELREMRDGEANKSRQKARSGGKRGK